MTNIDNRKMKTKDPKGRNLEKGITYRADRKRYYVKFTDMNGIRHEKSFKHYRDAKKYLTEVKHMKDKGLTPSDDKMTVDELFEKFCSVSLASGRPSTLNTYKCRYKAQIQPYIGRMKVYNVKYDDCQNIINNLWKNGRGDGEKYKRSTLTNLISTLQKLFQYALQADILQKSPAIDLRLPSDAVPPLETPHLKESDIPKFLAAAEKCAYFLQFFLLLETGLRIGELSALTWDDVFPEKNELYVRHTMNRVGNEWYMGLPKSHNGERMVPLTEKACKILDAQKDKSRFIPKVPGFENLIFRSKNGKPIFHGSYDDALKSICKKAGVNVISVHGLRHTFVTVMRMNGMNTLLLDKIIGHAEGNVTDKVYVHPTGSMLHEEMSKILENVAKMSA